MWKVANVGRGHCLLAGQPGRLTKSLSKRIEVESMQRERKTRKRANREKVDPPKLPTCKKRTVRGVILRARGEAARSPARHRSGRDAGRERAVVQALDSVT